MKYIYFNFKIFFVVGLLIFSYLSVRSQDILWEKSYGGQNTEYLFDAQPTFILTENNL